MLAVDNPYTITPDTWIISDTHFLQQNIGKYCSQSKDWQELIIKNRNDRISPGDTVLHLGDFALVKKIYFELLTGILNGKLFLFLSNHDRLSQTYCEPHGVTLIKNSIRRILNLQINLIFSDRPVVPLENGWINRHGDIHNIPPPPESSNLGPNHLSMSIEARESRPWRLKDIINPVRNQVDRQIGNAFS